jgi:O-antigen ligase
LFFIPWILMHFRSSWPGSFPKIAVAVLLLSFFFLCFILFLQGPQTVWNSVRSEEEIPDLFILARPQMGFLAGLLFFLSDQTFKLNRNRLLYGLSFAFTGLILLWILAKIALISFLLVMLLLQIWQLRKRPLVFAGITGFFVVCLLGAVLFVSKTGILAQAFSPGGLSFDQYPKAYVNSINSRLVLWQAGFQVLGEGNNLFSGVPSELLQPELDAAVGSLNAYLESRHLNPHNQFLYMLLHYGIPGLIVFCLFWFGLFRMSAVSAPVAGLWIFAFCCSQTEIYLDREFGSQLYLLLLVLSIQIQPSKLPDSPAGNV